MTVELEELEQFTLCYLVSEMAERSKDGMRHFQGKPEICDIFVSDYEMTQKLLKKLSIAGGDQCQQQNMKD